jgi:tripeptide aminopeptidase
MAFSLLKNLPLVVLLAAGGGIPLLTSPSGLASPDDVESMIAAPLPKEVKPEVAATVRTLTASPQVQQALALIKADEPRFIREAIQISEIPAPTFEEAKRAQAYAEMLKSNGLRDVRIDSINNVIGVRKGTGSGPKVAIVAHLDTVFDAKTDVKVKKNGDQLFGPGLTDDSAALASMLSWLRAMEQARIATPGDLYFVASVGEEGLGNLRGIRQFVRDHPDVSGYMILEPVPAVAAVIANTGVTRLEVTFKAPGGHSWVAFGKVPSANHALGRLVAKIADMPVPTSARTTYTVGIVKGGRSVNTISPEATLEIDIRSMGRDELQTVTRQVEGYAQQAVAEENKRWGTTSLSMSIKEIGNRPGGLLSTDHPILHGWMASAQSLGIQPQILVGSSTDAAIPLSMNIPTLGLGFGGVTGGFHALNENWNPTNAYKGVQLSFLTTLAMTGIDGVSRPLLSSAAPR